MKPTASTIIDNEFYKETIKEIQESMDKVIGSFVNNKDNEIACCNIPFLHSHFPLVKDTIKNYLKKCPQLNDFVFILQPRYVAIDRKTYRLKYRQIRASEFKFDNEYALNRFLYGFIIENKTKK